MKIGSYESHPAADVFPMIEGDERAKLEADIKANGLLEPVWRMQDGRILDGRNRLAACLAVGVEPRWREYEGDDPIGFVVSLNLHRRHLDVSQQAMVGTKIIDVQRELAAERMRATQAKPGEKANLRAPANLPEPNKGDARDHVARMLNISPRTVQHALNVKERGAPEVVRAVEQGRLAVSAAAAILDKSPEVQRTIVERVEKGEAKSVVEAVRQIKRETVAEEAITLPSSKYRVIYADPPWQYNDTRGGLESYAQTAAADHYPTMSVEELSELPVRELADDDAVLLCWATFPLLPDALDVVRAWGFKYKTAFVWAKGRPNFGHYHTASAELLLVCTRGSGVPDADKREDQVQAVTRDGRHSEKPEHFRAMVDRLWTSGRRIELFRRGAAPAGWEIWGNEAEAAA